MLFHQRLEILRTRSGVDNPVEAILTMARKLVRDCGITIPPFSPERFCEMTSIEVVKVYLNGFDARLLPTREGYIAEIHKSHPRSRQNYSICHEVGHTFFAHIGKPLSLGAMSCSESYSDSNQLEEKLCNYAAQELLMPEESFGQIVPKVTPSLDSLRQIANMYDTSLLATAFRIIALDLWPCTYVRIEPIELPDTPLRFEVKYYRASQSALNKRNGTRELVSSLRSKLLTRFDDRLGLEEVLRTGRTLDRRVRSDDDESTIQLYKYSRDKRPYIVGFAFHGST